MPHTQLSNICQGNQEHPVGKGWSLQQMVLGKEVQKIKLNFHIRPLTKN